MEITCTAAKTTVILSGAPVRPTLVLVCVRASRVIMHPGAHNPCQILATLPDWTNLNAGEGLWAPALLSADNICTQSFWALITLATRNMQFAGNCNFILLLSIWNANFAAVRHLLRYERSEIWRKYNRTKLVSIRRCFSIIYLQKRKIGFLNLIYGKNDFAEGSKIFAGYRSENNLVGIFKNNEQCYKKFWYSSTYIIISIV